MKIPHEHFQYLFNLYPDLFHEDQCFSIKYDWLEIFEYHDSPSYYYIGVNLSIDIIPLTIYTTDKQLLEEVLEEISITKVLFI